MDKDEEIREKITDIYYKHKGIYGYRRITIELNRAGYRINHKKVYRIMKEGELYAVIRKKNKQKAAAMGVMKVAGDKLKRDFKSDRKWEKFVSDITEIRGKGWKLYFMIIQDLYNNEIVGYGVSESNDMNLVHGVIKEWLKSGKYREGSIFHTDRGFQYTHILTAKMLKMHGIEQSMSRKGVPEDNGPAESFFSHFKEEVVKIERDKTKEEYKKLIDDYIEFYNNRRYQMRLNKMAPVEYRSRMYGT